MGRKPKASFMLNYFTKGFEIIRFFHKNTFSRSEGYVGKMIHKATNYSYRVSRLKFEFPQSMRSSKKQKVYRGHKESVSSSHFSQEFTNSHELSL